MSQISKTFYAKRASFLSSTSGKNLQTLLSASLKTLSLVGQRKEQPELSSPYYRSIISYKVSANMIFGAMAAYEQGNVQLTVAIDDQASMLSVDKIAAGADQNGKIREFLEGVCFFGIYGNHVVVVPSRALSVKNLEQHLSWLLETSGQFGSTNRVSLGDQINADTKAKIRAAHVKSFEIGSPLIEAKPSTTQVVSSNTKDVSLKLGFSETIKNLLIEKLGKDKVDKLDLTKSLDSDISVSLKVTYKGRSGTEDSHKLLDEIAIGLRNVDEDEVKISLVGGGDITGKELKMRHTVSVKGKDGVPETTDLYEKMHSWLSNLIESKVIEP